MSLCEFLVDRGRRAHDGIIHEPCAQPATKDEPCRSGPGTFHWCDLHDTAAKRDAERAKEQI